jgi:tripartite-type tricarboxylate transporter receptor subunit TctC
MPSMMFDSVPSAMPHIEGGRTRVFAVCGTKRYRTLPDVPTMAEAGVSGYQAASSGALFAPLGTPAPAVAQLSAAVAELVNSAPYREQLGRAGGDAEHSTPEGLAQMMAAESETWGTIVREAKVTAN